MRPLSGLDAAFLYLEVPRAPMHVAALSIFETGIDAPSLDFAAVRAHVAARLHLVRTYRERLVRVPLNLGHPYWVDDPIFDLDHHLHHARLPAPGGWSALRTLMADVISRPLDQSRPLWEMVFIEGLDTVEGVPPGSVALIGKVHHAASDGLAGSSMLGVMLDATSDPPPAATPTPWQPSPVPDDLAVLRRTSLDTLGTPRRVFDLFSASVRSAIRLPVVARAAGIRSLPWLYTAPHTRLNVPVNARRTWDGCTISLDRIKAVKNQLPGITVNDVILAVSAGALRHYLLAHDDLPQKPLIAMVPINTRPAETQSAMGNEVSAILVKLATDEADPVRRLMRIHAGASQSKAYHHAVDARGIVEATQLIPFALASAAARLYTGSRVTGRINPIFNCVITNVPGSPVPLYLHGARMIRTLGMTPIYDGVGLLITVFSYAGTVTLTATSCSEIMPDTDVFVGCVQEALAELEGALRSGVGSME
jgi:WS/DGAT/MGAT family acyltransferase